MKKLLLGLLFILISTNILLSANNIFFYKTPGSITSIGIINGATGDTTQNFQLTPNDSILFIDNGDFNGDGRDDIACIYKSSGTIYLKTIDGSTLLNFNNSSIGNSTSQFLYMKIGDYNNSEGDDIAYIYKNISNGNTYLSVLEGNNLENELHNTLIAQGDTEEVLFAEVLDFDNDGGDDIAIIQKDSTNGYYRFLKVIDGENGADTSGRLWWGNDIGEILFMNTGDFTSNENDDVVYYQKCGHLGCERRFAVVDYFSISHDTTDIIARNISGAGNSNELLFQEVADLNADGYDEIIYVRLNNAISPDLLPDKGFLSYNQYRIESFNMRTRSIHWSKGIGGINYYFIGLDKGDFNGDGYEDIVIFFKDNQNIQYRIYNGLTGDTLRNKTICTTLDTLFSKGVGDFDGDGKDDVYYVFVSGSSNQIWTHSPSKNETIWHKNLNYSLTNPFYFSDLGPRCHYMSYPEDKKYNAIEVNDVFGQRIFPIGWYDGVWDIWYNDKVNGGGLIVSCVQDRIDQLTGYSPANTMLVYTWRCSSCSTDFHLITEYIDSISDITDLNQYPYPKVTIIDIYDYHHGDTGYPMMPNVNDSIFQHNFFQLDSNPNVILYYIADDLRWCVEGTHTPAFWYSWEQVESLYTFVKNNSSKLALAGENSYYHRMNIGENHDYYDIPLMYEYPFKYPDTLHMLNSKLLALPKSMYELNDSCNVNNKPGFIHVAQAHGFYWQYEHSYTERSPSWKEIRYEAFNAIVNGSIGLLYYAYHRSDIFYLDGDDNVINKINNLMRELTSPSIQRALLNEDTDAEIKIFCSKDGYDSDFDSLYDSIAPWTNYSPYQGMNLADINYIIRKDSVLNYYYIFVVNNSEFTQKDIRFYIDPITPWNPYNLYEYYIDSFGDSFIGNSVTISVTYDTIRKDGDRYYYFDIDSIEGFGVKNFCFGNPLSDFSEHIRYNTPSNGNAISTPRITCSVVNNLSSGGLVSFILPFKSHVKINVYNILGQRVRTLADDERQPGAYEIIWDGRDNHGTQVSSGSYFLRFEAGEFRTTKSLTVIR